MWIARLRNRCPPKVVSLNLVVCSCPLLPEWRCCPGTFATDAQRSDQYYDAMSYCFKCEFHNHRVTTNLENLEYSGISTNMENSGNSVQPQGKFLTNKIVSFRSDIRLTQQGLGLQMNKVMDFIDGQSALVTCYFAGVDVEWPLTYEGHYYINYFLLQ